MDTETDYSLVVLAALLDDEIRASTGASPRNPLLASWDLPTFLELSGTVRNGVVTEWNLVFDPQSPRNSPSISRPELAKQQLQRLAADGQLDHLRGVFEAGTVGLREDPNFSADFQSGLCMLPPWADRDDVEGVTLGVRDLAQQGQSLLVLGAMGSGKSTLVRLMVHQHIDSSQSQAPFPILLTLRNVAAKLHQRLQNDGMLSPVDLVRTALPTGTPDVTRKPTLVAVDGLDELYVVLPRSAADAVVSAVLTALDEFAESGTQVVATSRPGVVQLHSSSLLLPIEVAPLSPAEARRLVTVQQPSLAGHQDLSTFLAALPPDLSSSPLFLSVVASLLATGSLPRSPSRWTLMKQGLRDMIEGRLLRRTGEDSLEAVFRCDYDTLTTELGSLALSGLGQAKPDADHFGISKSQLVDALLNVDDRIDVARVLTSLTRDSGFMQIEQSRILFTHRIFQEALATHHLLNRRHSEALYAELATALTDNPFGMRGVALLYVDALLEEGRRADLMEFSDFLAQEAEERQRPNRDALIWLAMHIVTMVLNAQMKLSRRDRLTVDQLRPLAESIVESPAQISLGDRISIAEGLAKVGDARPGVGLTASELPDISWCAIPSGEYLIGLSSEQLDVLTASGSAQAAREYPAVTVRLAAFEIARFPITWRQYAAFLESPSGYRSVEWWSSSPVDMKQLPQRCAELQARATLPTEPVRAVDWFEALAFTRWLSSVTGDEITLPTEEQWEAAGRRFSAHLFPWGETFIGDRCNWEGSGLGRVIPVGCFQSVDSLHPDEPSDMLGNVWEWTSSIAGTSTSGSFVALGTARTDLATEGDVRRVVRGLCYLNGVGMMRLSYRGSDLGSSRFERQGFRVVRNVR